MGVRGLQTYMEVSYPAACERVNLMEIAFQYGKEVGCRPQLVIDTPCCYKMLYGDACWATVFQSKEYYTRLEEFVAQFTRSGWDLIFFFGGTTPLEKRRNWMDRRRENAVNSYGAINALENGVPFADVPENYKILPPNMGYITSTYLKHHMSCHVRVALGDDDIEIAEFARFHRCYAILTQDTDFVIYDTGTRVFSIKNLRFPITLAYNRHKLADGLNLRVDELKFLAIICGNDYTSYKKLENFHKELCGIQGDRNASYAVLMPAAAQYIRSIRQFTEERKLRMIYEKIKVFKFEEITTGFNSYKLPPPIPAVNEDFAERSSWGIAMRFAAILQQECHFPPAILAVCVNRLYEGSINLEDLRESNNRYGNPSEIVLKDLRERLYGVLLLEKPEYDVVAEWCTDFLEKPAYQTVTPRYPNRIDHPGLMAMWTQTRGANQPAMLQEMKWKLFLRSVSPTICNFDEWVTIHPKYLIPAAAVHYLYHVGFFSYKSACALLCSIVAQTGCDSGRLKSLVGSRVDPIVSKIGVAYSRCFHTMICLMAACGYPSPPSKDLLCFYFEGDLFHHVFTSMKLKELSNDVIKGFCFQNDNIFRTYLTLHHVVFSV